MKPSDHPLYGKIGAFWVEGHAEPFYGIHSAMEYQAQNGGNVLDCNGKMIYKFQIPEVANSVSEKMADVAVPDFNESKMAAPKKSGNWIMNLFSRA